MFFAYPFSPCHFICPHPYFLALSKYGYPSHSSSYSVTFFTFYLVVNMYISLFGFFVAFRKVALIFSQPYAKRIFSVPLLYSLFLFSCLCSFFFLYGLVVFVFGLKTKSQNIPTSMYSVFPSSPFLSLFVNPHSPSPSIPTLSPCRLSLSSVCISLAAGLVGPGRYLHRTLLLFLQRSLCLPLCLPRLFLVVSHRLSHLGELGENGRRRTVSELIQGEPAPLSPS